MRVCGPASRDGKKKVLFAVDEYNAMFGPTDMHEVLGARKRGNIAAGSTRLLASLRDANAAVAAGCAYVAATSGTIQLSPKLSAALTTAEAPGSEALERRGEEDEHQGDLLHGATLRARQRVARGGA